MESKLNKMFRIFIIFLIPLMIYWDFHWFEPAAKKNTQGIKAYDKKDYNKSLQLFLEAKGIKNSPEVINNTASALYQLKQFDKALNEYSKIDLKKMMISQPDLSYNIGNVLFKMKKYKEALEAYKQSLLLNHSDLDAKKNYELTLQKIKEQEDKKKQNKDQNKDQKDQEKKDQSEQKKNKHQNLMNYLNQKEEKQLKKKKRKVKIAVGRKKDW